MIKVSVIIPFYNQNKIFLEQALYSVIRQTLKEIEIICIDDGSDVDDCSLLVNNLIKIDNRIKLIHKNHSGSAESRNMGIEAANGENIMFLDSDDFYPDSKIFEKLYNIKHCNNVKITGGKHLILDNGCFNEPYFNYGDINGFFSNKIVDYKDFQFPWWYWCYMFDLKLIKDNNILFPNYLRYQDPPFFVRAMNTAECFYAADFTSYIHRNSDKLFTMTKDKAFDHVRGIANVLKYSKEHNLDKLYNLLYTTFFDYDINILNNIKDIDDEDKAKLTDIIKKLSE